MTRARYAKVTHSKQHEKLLQSGLYAVSRTAQRAYIATDSGAVRCFGPDLADLGIVYTTLPLTGIAIRDDGERVALFTESGGTIASSKLTPNIQLETEGTPDAPFGSSFTFHGKHLWFATRGGELLGIDSESGTCEYSVSLPKGSWDAGPACIVASETNWLAVEVRMDREFGLFEPEDAEALGVSDGGYFLGFLPGSSCYLTIEGSVVRFYERPGDEGPSSTMQCGDIDHAAPLLASEHPCAFFYRDQSCTLDVKNLTFGPAPLLDDNGSDLASTVMWIAPFGKTSLISAHWDWHIRLWERAE